jgi:predicted enzyme related to lactoylglutathione lyase
MEFKLALIAVEDVEASKKFYIELFDQQVTLDLGWNVTFSGGFAIQQNFGWLVGLPEDAVSKKPNNMELYFEVDDIDAFIKRLEQYPGVKYVHPVKKHDWQQRVLRIYDLDGHIIEIGESMQVVARRFLDQGYSVEETAAVIQHPVAFVRAVSKNNL